MNFFNRNRNFLIILGVIAIPPLLDLFPAFLQIYFQIPLCLALTVFLFTMKEELGSFYEKIAGKFDKGTYAVNADGTPKLTEIHIFRRLGFHLMMALITIWLWGGAVASLFRLIEGSIITKEASVFASFTFLTAAAIVYIVLVFSVLWVVKSRRHKDDYPFLLKPREKTLIIYFAMTVLVTLLAFIYKKVFGADVIRTFIDIIITIAVMVVISPIYNLARLAFLYKVTWLKSPEEFFEASTAFRIREFCKARKLRMPYIIILEDNAPVQAYTFGYGPLLSWVVLPRGMKQALSTEELESVIMHEMGHVGHWDFLASAAPAIMLSSVFRIVAGSASLLHSPAGHIQTMVIFTSVFIINYAVVALQQFLSRTREYYADEYSAEGSGNPDYISGALAKITYCLTGPAYKAKVDLDVIRQAMSWDLTSPWAKLTEFMSSHPLTANRVRYMSVLSQTLGHKTVFSSATEKMTRVFHFLLDLFMQWLYSIGFAGSILLLFKLADHAYGFTFLIFGIALLLAVLYRYPLFMGFREKKCRELATDISASPVYGIPVKITGHVVGRMDPGSKFCPGIVVEDESGMMLSDYELLEFNFIPAVKSNFLIQYLNPFNLYKVFLGFFRTPDWIGTTAELTGFYRRVGSSGYLDIIKMKFADGRTYRSYTMWAVMLLGLLMSAVGAAYIFFI
ncbi:MAG: M48 family metalloprotease [Firmicutes bacterium]|nr:M48 family metalloprotease [Bacillota bacterium]